MCVYNTRRLQHLSWVTTNRCGRDDGDARARASAVRQRPRIRNRTPPSLGPLEVYCNNDNDDDNYTRDVYITIRISNVYYTRARASRARRFGN